MDEYPKVIRIGGGTFTVHSVDEEARYRTPPKSKAKGSKKKK